MRNARSHESQQMMAKRASSHSIVVTRDKARCLYSELPAISISFESPSPVMGLIFLSAPSGP